MKFICATCGWNGNNPKLTISYCPKEICPKCHSDRVITPGKENPFDQFNPFFDQNQIGLGSKVWTFGFEQFGIVIGKKNKREYVKIAFPNRFGRIEKRFIKINRLGRISK